MARKSRGKRGVAVQEQEVVAQESEQEQEAMHFAVVADIAEVVAEPETKMDSVDAAVAVTKEALIEKREARGRKPWSAEARMALSLKLRQHYQEHPEEKIALAEKIRNGWTTEKKLAHAAKMHEVLNRPEVKARMKEGMKYFWDNFRKTRKQMDDVEQQQA
jgi:hypothetical protein